MCMKKQCYVVGSIGNVKYELNMYTDSPLNWTMIHEHMISFVKQIQVFIK